MVLVVAEEDLNAALKSLNDCGEKAWHLGQIVPSDDGKAVTFVN